MQQRLNDFIFNALDSLASFAEVLSTPESHFS